MDKSTLQSKLQFISTKKVGLELYFLYRKKVSDPIEILRANLEGTQVQSRLESVFVNKIKADFLNQDEEGKSLSDDVEWVLKHIREVDEIKNTYYYFPNEVSEEDEYHIPDEFKEMAHLYNRKFENITLFEFGKHLLEDVFAYLIRIQIDDEQIIVFKQKYTFDLLSRSTILKLGSLEIVDHKSKFSLEKAPLLKISDGIDFMFVDNKYVIINLKLLESKYGFNERYLKQGAESLELLKKKNILINTDKFDELIKKVSFSKKMMKVKGDNKVLKTSIQDMKNFLEGYKTPDGKHNLAKRIKYNPTQDKFEVTTKIAAEDFIRLLNDQYLMSLLTKQPYVSDSQILFGLKE